jgi:IrrE N-terminal-like domain
MNPGRTRNLPFDDGLQVLAPRGLKADRGHSYISLEKEAVALRRMFKIDLDRPIDGVALWNAIPYRLVSRVAGCAYHVDVDIRPLDNGRIGQACWDSAIGKFLISLTEDSYRRLELGQVWDLIHEIMHVRLHPRLLQRLKSSEYLEKAYNERFLKHSHRSSRDTEWQANAGAAAVIMPAIGICKLEQRVRHDELLLRLENSFRVRPVIVQRRWEIYLKYKSDLLTASAEVQLSRKLPESIHSSPWANWAELSSKRGSQR